MKYLGNVDADVGVLLYEFQTAYLAFVNPLAQELFF